MTTDNEPADTTYYSQFDDALAIADELLGPADTAPPAPANEGQEAAALTLTQLWTMIDCADVSDNVRSKIMGYVTQRGGIDEAVFEVAQREVARGIALCRLRRTMLTTSMFEAIRDKAETMISEELVQLEAITPELIEAHRSSIEQQAAIARHMQEAHKSIMEGALKRSEIYFEINNSQIDNFNEQMTKSRAASDARHTAFMASLRGR